MATTLTAENLRVVVSESINLNGQQQGSNNTFTIGSISNVVKRIVTATTTEVGLLECVSALTSLGSAMLAGTFKLADVRYIRITNLDDTNFVQLICRSAGNHEFAIKLDAGQSWIVPMDNVGGAAAIIDANTSALTVALDDLADITVKADASSVDLEVFVAST